MGKLALHKLWTWVSSRPPPSCTITLRTRHIYVNDPTPLHRATLEFPLVWSTVYPCYHKRCWGKTIEFTWLCCFIASTDFSFWDNTVAAWVSHPTQRFDFGVWQSMNTARAIVDVRAHNFQLWTHMLYVVLSVDVELISVKCPQLSSTFIIYISFLLACTSEVVGICERIISSIID